MVYRVDYLLINLDFVFFFFILMQKINMYLMILHQKILLPYQENIQVLIYYNYINKIHIKNNYIINFYIKMKNLNLLFNHNLVNI